MKFNPDQDLSVNSRLIREINLRLHSICRYCSLKNEDSELFIT
jgi:hypothetical protein